MFCPRPTLTLHFHAMKRLLLAFLITSTTAFADTSFPGVTSIMSLKEFHAAGLDKLSPEQLKALDGAIMRHFEGAVKTAAKQEANKIASETIALEEERSLLQRFGLPSLSLTQDWRNKPALTGRVTRWVGGNSFQLENGQIWEGGEPIVYELVDKEIEISPRPNGQFALVVDGKNTTIRIRRVK